MIAASIGQGEAEVSVGKRSSPQLLRDVQGDRGGAKHQAECAQPGLPRGGSCAITLLGNAARQCISQWPDVRIPRFLHWHICLGFHKSFRCVWFPLRPFLLLCFCQKNNCCEMGAAKVLTDQLCRTWTLLQPTSPHDLSSTCDPSKKNVQAWVSETHTCLA